MLFPMNFVQTKRLSDEELRAFPKIELHRHLEGALRLGTVAEISKALGRSVPTDLEDLQDYFLVTSPMRDLKTVLDKFWRSQAILHSEEILSRITFEAIEDAVHDGIRILELRYSFTFIQENHSSLSFQKILSGIGKGLQLAKNLPVAVGMICTIQRTLPLSASMPVIEFVLDNREHFVGVDLADDELANAPDYFLPLFKPAAEAGLPITIHAGESIYPQTTAAVRDAIDLLHAKRIGHGVQSFRDPDLIHHIREKGIALELCPTSNYLTNAVSSLASHPIRQLLNAGVHVTINSDDPGIFGIDLTHEYKILRDLHGFVAEDFRRCNAYAYSASFIPAEKKSHFWSHL